MAYVLVINQNYLKQYLIGEVIAFSQKFFKKSAFIIVV